MAITFRDEKGAPLTHEELDANFRSFFFTASFGANQLLLQRKDGTSLTVPIGGEAFADFQANGGSIGDVYIANSEVTGSRMIINLFSGSFYDKTKGPGSDGGDLDSDEWYITFNPQSSANYYVHFGSNFAISSSGYMHASGAVIEGEITASAGLIGGFNITPHAIVGPETLGVPSFYISGSAANAGYFISSSAFNVKGTGEITGSDVLFTGGKIAGWDITNTQIRKSTNIILDASDNSFSINSATYGNEGIQLQYNGGTPRFHVGNGTTSYVKFDGTDVSVSTRLLEISASNLEISSTEASMSLGDGKVELLGAQGKITAGTSNKVRLEGNANDAFLVAGAKTTFGNNDAGVIIGMDSTVATLDLTKNASNYFRFNTTTGVDIRTETFKLDTTYFDIDTTTQRLNIFDTGSKEIIRLGEISDDASDLYGIKIYDGTGTGSADTIAMFGQQGNKIGGWEVTDSQIRSIPASGFGGAYAEGETGLIIHSDGRLESSNFASNVKGWRIDTLGNGSAEFENMRIRGTLKTTVFEKESVNVVGGQLMVANATTIQPLRSEAGAIIAGSSSYADTAVTFSVANVSGFEEGEILKVKSVDDTGFSVEYLYLSGSKRYSQDSSLSYNTGSIDPDGLAGEIYVQRAFGGVPAVSSSVTTILEDLDDVETDITVASTASLAIQNIIKIDDERFKITSISTSGNVLTVIRDYHDTVADSHTNGDSVFLIDTDKEFLAGLVSTAKPYNEGQVLVSTGVYNPAKDITSGYMIMNANPRDISTPYMDIVERTGSGVYDLELRTRLGDLSGLSSAYLYGDDEPGFGIYTENGYFKGAITAQTGSIAGILHVATVQGGLETGQKISIGRDVQGTNDGIYVNNNNYWYTDGAWKVGGQNNFISLDNFTDGNLNIKTQTFSLETPTFIISSSLNSGALKAGVSASVITNTAGDGIYMDGTGKFRVGTATSGDNYIYWDGSTLNIKGSVDISGGSAASEAYVNTAASGSIDTANAFTNASTASLSGSVATVTDTLDGKIFTDSAGRAVRPPTASATGLYLTSTNLGFYESGKWKTYMDNTGDFFLTGSAGNKLAWDAGTGTLEIKGAITITGGNAATQDYVTGSVGTLSGSLATSLSASNASLSNSITSASSSLASNLSDLDAVTAGKAAIFRQGTSPSTSGRTVGDVWIHTGQQNKMYIWNGTQFSPSSDGTYDQAALINSTSASLSSSVALDIFTDSSGKLVKTPNTSSAGLYLGDTNLGFYSGSEWKTYMANNGNFYLTGSDSNYLAWDGTSLTIAGAINITGGNATTQAQLNTSSSALQTHAQNAANTAESNANTFTNSATSSLSGSLATGISASNAELSSSVASVSGDLNSVSASQASVNEGLQGVVAGKNSIFRQASAPGASGRTEGDIWIDNDDGNKVYVWGAGNAWTASADTTYDQTQAINSTSASIALDIFTDSTGKIQRSATLSGEGLFMDDTNLGYYSGSKWKTYMANNGNFFLTGSSSNYLAWDGTSLTIAGTINIVGGNAATTTDVSNAQSAAQTFATNAANEASSSLTGSITQAQTDATTAAGTATQASQAAASASAAAATASNAASTVQSNLNTATGSLQTSINNTAATASAQASAAQSAAIAVASTSASAAQAAAIAVASTSASAAQSAAIAVASTSASAAQAAAIAVASTSASAAQAAATAVANAAQSTANLATGSAAAAQATANTAVTRSVDASGKIAFNPTPTGTGLFMSADNLGYYDTDTWKTYMSSSGDFYLAGSGNNGLSWDGSDLSIDGTVVASAGSIGGIELGAEKMYISGGVYNNVNTPFFISSSGKFSLGDKLVWDGTNLSIEGSITITNSSFATTTELSQAAATASAEASAAEAAAIAVAASSASAAQTAAVNASTANLNASSSALESFATTAAAEASQSVAGNLTGSISSAASAASASQATANQGVADAVVAQNAVDAIETQLVLSSDGMELKDQNSNTLASYGTTTTIGRNANDESRIFIDSDSVDLIVDSGGTDSTQASFGATTTIGATATEHVEITSTTLKLKDGSTTRLSMDSTGLTMGNNISINSSGNATFSGNLSAAGGSFAGSLAVGSSNNILKVDTLGNLHIGHANFASAPFKVTKAGAITATSGTIGVVTLGATKMYIGAGNMENSDTQLYIDNSGNFSLGDKLLFEDGDLTINGSVSITNTLSADKLQGGSISSTNHSGTGDGSGFSTSGSKFNLSDGSLSTPKLYISASGAVEFGGVVNGAAGITGSLIQGAKIKAGTIDGAELVGGALYVPDVGNPNFAVDSQGFMTASDANISGTITAQAGTIGEWVIDGSTGELRDNDSEIIFSPNPAEIQMYAGGDKKVIIAPTADLTSAAGGTQTMSVSNSITQPSATATNPYGYVYAETVSSLGATSFTPSSAGDLEVTVDVPYFIPESPGSNQTVTNAVPAYTATNNGQTFGLNFASRKQNSAELFLQAVQHDNSNNVLGEVSLGKATRRVGNNSYTYYVASGSTGTVDDPFGLFGVTSVVGSTEIELQDGTYIQAKDVTTDTAIKVWDWVDGKNELVEGSISKVLKTTQPQYIDVTTETKKIQVSLSHGFWLDGNVSKNVTTLLPGEDEIYIVVGNELKKEKVLAWELINEPVEVYTFKVPKYNNYISNGILSHNPITGTSYAWVATTQSAIAATSNPVAAATNKVVTININSATQFKFRYKLKFGARGGTNLSRNSLGVVTTTLTNQTNNQWNGSVNAPVLSQSVDLAVPTNFVEIKAGGIQVVSDADKFVKIPRIPAGATTNLNIFTAKGGLMHTDSIRPNSNNASYLGINGYRWSSVGAVAGDFSGAVATGNLTVTGAITATGNITAFKSSDERLKENIINLDGSLSKVLKLRGTRFDWREGNDEIHPHEGNDIGFIAQEVKEIIPEVVGEMHGGYYGVQYDKLTPILVEAIKELSKKVDILEQKLKDKE